MDRSSPFAPADGQLAATSAGRATFEFGRWLEHDGDSREPKDVLNKGKAFRCDGIGCVAKAAGDTTLSVARHGSAFADDCAAATILIATIPAPKECEKPALVLDYPRFREEGGIRHLFRRAVARPQAAEIAAPKPVMRIETIAASARRPALGAATRAIRSRHEEKPAIRKNASPAEDAEKELVTPDSDQ